MTHGYDLVTVTTKHSTLKCNWTAYDAVTTILYYTILYYTILYYTVNLVIVSVIQLFGDINVWQTVLGDR